MLVLDEPSTLLDLRNRELLRRTLAGLSQQIIMSTHDLDLALDMDRVLVVEAGQVVFDGGAAAAVDHYRALSAAGSARGSPGRHGRSRRPGAAVSGHGFLLANYVPGASVIHRSPLWLKFLLVLGCGMASFLIVDWAAGGRGARRCCACCSCSAAPGLSGWSARSGPCCPFCW